MKKILLVFGTRPEAIKMAPLVMELRKYPDEFEAMVCVTGQHRQMLDQALDVFDITPDYDLDIMHPRQDLTDITTKTLEGLRDIFAQTEPDAVVVQGDTTTAMAAALAAYYHHIRVYHIEAGLRTRNIYSPWPEEINRQVISRIAVHHFAPTASCRSNLLMENVADDRITVTGNTVIDALIWAVEKINSSAHLKEKIAVNLSEAGYDPTRLADGKKLILITGHRRENFGEGLHSIFRALGSLTARYPDVDFVYPVHPNPRVSDALESVFGHSIPVIPNLHLIKPLDYLPFLFLMEKSTAILTDSGGLQEEAPALGKPVLVMRDTTERPEAISAGTARLTGTDYNTIIEEVCRLLDDSDHYISMAQVANPYGDGHAGRRIVETLRTIENI